MIYDYGYEHAIPYKYVLYRKLDKDEFAEEIKSKLDSSYRNIKNIIVVLWEQWTEMQIVERVVLI